MFVRGSVLSPHNASNARRLLTNRHAFYGQLLQLISSEQAKMDNLADTFIEMRLISLGCKNIVVEKNKWGRELTIRFRKGKRKWSISRYNKSFAFELYRDSRPLKPRKDWESVINLFKKLWNKP